MALRLALVVSATESSPTGACAGVGCLRAVDHVCILSAVAGGHLLLLAGLAASWVAVPFALMFLAVEASFALLAALEDQPFFTTLDHALALAALAAHHHALLLTGRTLALVAPLRTGMCTVGSSFATAYFPAGMGR